jgi:hypothetical protein
MLKASFRKILLAVIRSKPAGALFPVAYKHASRDLLLLDLLRFRHFGERCVIFGGWASLTVEDISRLYLVYTFACDKVYFFQKLRQKFHNGC